MTKKARKGTDQYFSRSVKVTCVDNRLINQRKTFYWFSEMRFYYIKRFEPSYVELYEIRSRWSIQPGLWWRSRWPSKAGPPRWQLFCVEEWLSFHFHCRHLCAITFIMWICPEIILGICHISCWIYLSEFDCVNREYVRSMSKVVFERLRQIKAFPADVLAGRCFEWSKLFMQVSSILCTSSRRCRM